MRIKSGAHLNLCCERVMAVLSNKLHFKIFLFQVSMTTTIMLKYVKIQ